MANKRIELEQYKRYVDLIQEEPNRKRWRQGVQAALVTAMLVALLFFVLGIMSGNQASNPRNVLEAPPAPQDVSPASPEGFPVNPEGVPGGESPLDQQPSPSPIPLPDQGKAPGREMPGPAGWALHGALLARAEPLQVQDTPPVQEQTVPDAGETVPGQEQTVPGAEQTVPGQQETSEPAGPGEQTTGVGNLANLTNGAGGRGFQLYLLALLVILVTLLYLPIRRARMEAKSR